MGQGTYYFLAIELLERPAVKHAFWHDLESFFWVLIWVVLHYTAHTHPAGKRAAFELFKFGDDDAAFRAKLWWLRRPECELAVVGNKPLTMLIERLRKLVEASYDLERPKRLSYDAVEAIFAVALKSKEWPKHDKAIA